MAGLAAAQWQLERAARLYGAEQAIRVAIGAVVLGDVSRFERDAAAARAAMGEARFEALAAEGRTFTSEQAIAYGLSNEDAAGATPIPSHRLASPLTPREQEVAALVAYGRSNRAIADELVISERTVEKHVANILARLELSSRAQVAVWAYEHVGGNLRGDVRASTHAGTSAPR
ncbi:MAG: response regulator transcription factor [Chloroflexi bacterium]|nr:response regulator transcription factor [Chloroflexota bacterium]